MADLYHTNSNFYSQTVPPTVRRWDATARALVLDYLGKLLLRVSLGAMLMLHGIYDEDTPLRSQGEPLYKLLPGPKKLITYPGGHVPPSDLQFSSLSAWLDGIVGPVRR